VARVQSSEGLSGVSSNEHPDHLPDQDFVLQMRTDPHQILEPRLSARFIALLVEQLGMHHSQLGQGADAHKRQDRDHQRLRARLGEEHLTPGLVTTQGRSAPQREQIWRVPPRDEPRPQLGGVDVDGVLGVEWLIPRGVEAGIVGRETAMNRRDDRHRRVPVVLGQRHQCLQALALGPDRDRRELLGLERQPGFPEAKSPPTQDEDRRDEQGAQAQRSLREPSPVAPKPATETDEL